MRFLEKSYQTVESYLKPMCINIITMLKYTNTKNTIIIQRQGICFTKYIYLKIHNKHYIIIRSKYKKPRLCFQIVSMRKIFQYKIVMLILLRKLIRVSLKKSTNCNFSVI